MSPSLSSLNDTRKGDVPLVAALVIPTVDLLRYFRYAEPAWPLEVTKRSHSPAHPVTTVAPSGTTTMPKELTITPNPSAAVTHVFFTFLCSSLAIHYQCERETTNPLYD
jgi:hypothetical protein